MIQEIAFVPSIVAVLTLIVFDVIWLNIFMGDRYNKMIPNIQNSPMVVKYWSAGCAYLLMVVGLLFFVLPNITERTSILVDMLYGGLFGLVVYGVYDFTAGAVFKNWDFELALCDIAWGVFVYALSALFYKLSLQWYGAKN